MWNLVSERHNNCFGIVATVICMNCQQGVIMCETIDIIKRMNKSQSERNRNNAFETKVPSRLLCFCVFFVLFCFVSFVVIVTKRKKERTKKT